MTSYTSHVRDGRNRYNQLFGDASGIGQYLEDMGKLIEGIRIRNSYISESRYEAAMKNLALHLTGFGDGAIRHDDVKTATRAYRMAGVSESHHARRRFLEYSVRELRKTVLGQ
ncbi:MAG: hypothetical protein QMD85_00965 [Candidatus Aenigmarchaeota archaeon]|nr:hypothetical protein [Candidatus Aenigmarchaeota archaeon]MDI6722110.1 hypothetical protein [Candidatus Aenigmarchaeota archaeon]